MKQDKFLLEIQRLQKEYKVLIDTYAPSIVGNEAVSFYKKSFQKEAWGRVKWKEVSRRERDNVKGADKTSAILTGKTGDLGRSIEIKEKNIGRVVIWTNPDSFSSKVPYGRVHNEGLRAGRGKGFIMPKRQFMGYSEELNQLIIDKLESKLKQIHNR